MKVRANQTQSSCNTHNFFRFDMFFLLIRIRFSVWGTEDINIGGSALTNINFASLGSQIKFIDIMKYHLSSLGSLVSTLEISIFCCCCCCCCCCFERMTFIAFLREKWWMKRNITNECCFILF